MFAILIVTLPLDCVGLTLLTASSKNLSSLWVGNTASLPASPTPIRLGLSKIPPSLYQLTPILGGNDLLSGLIEPLILKMW